jgi:excinuclease ABC subunit A
MGNTVVVVEHDEDTMRPPTTSSTSAPAPACAAARSSPRDGCRRAPAPNASVTGQYLSGRRDRDPRRERPATASARVRRARAHNNLKNVDVEIPLGAFVCVTGVSGSGKSSLVNDILVEALRRDLNGGEGEPGAHERIEGLEHLDKLIAIDQSPIGRTPRSNPAPTSRCSTTSATCSRSCPSRSARLQAGPVQLQRRRRPLRSLRRQRLEPLEMDFLADVWVTCPVCEGHRFNRETLQVRSRTSRSPTCWRWTSSRRWSCSRTFPQDPPQAADAARRGLDYMKLGPAVADALGRRGPADQAGPRTGQEEHRPTLYLLDEPTTGLHFADIKLLLKVLHGFVDAGNTVLVVEHNLDVIKTADWIIDLGPEGGDAGGRIVAPARPKNWPLRRVVHRPGLGGKLVLGNGRRNAGRRGAAKRPAKPKPPAANAGPRGREPPPRPDQRPRRPAAQPQGRRRRSPATR